MNKERLLKWIMYGAGLLSLFALAVGYSPTLHKLVTVGDQEYGEFYRLTKVSYFKEPIPEVKHEGYEPPQGFTPIAPESSTRVLTMGDSFIWLSIGYRDFTTELEDRTGESMGYVGHWMYHNPFEYISQYEDRLDERRILVLGIIERNLYEAFERPWPVRTYRDPGTLRSIKRTIDPIGAYVFTGLENRLRYLAEYNRVSFFFQSLYRDYQFNNYGEISGWTPLYLMEPRQQFHYKSVKDDGPAGYFYSHSDSLITHLAQNIQRLRDDLREHANTELILVPIPNKVTIYQDYLDVPYDNYLPRLHAELEARGVKVANLYEPFRASTERLYYISDPHWNAAGREIAYEEVQALLREIEAEWKVEAESSL